MNSSSIVPFGKHKGKPVEALAEDREYVEWLAGQAWFRERYPAIYQTVVVNNFGEPAETPEHNALQARFLDSAFTDRFLRAAFPHILARFKQIVERWQENLAQAQAVLRALEAELPRALAEFQACDLRERECRYEVNEPAERKTTRSQLWEARREAHRRIDEIEHAKEITDRCIREPKLSWQISEPRFEPIDVVIRFFARCEHEFGFAGFWNGAEILIEIKPALGDDYPAVMRQILAQTRGKHGVEPVLLAERYTGSGATLDQVRAMFAASGITLVMLAELKD